MALVRQGRSRISRSATCHRFWPRSLRAEASSRAAPALDMTSRLCQREANDESAEKGHARTLLNEPGRVSLPGFHIALHPLSDVGERMNDVFGIVQDFLCFFLD